MVSNVYLPFFQFHDKIPSTLWHLTTTGLLIRELLNQTHTSHAKSLTYSDVCYPIDLECLENLAHSKWLCDIAGDNHQQSEAFGPLCRHETKCPIAPGDSHPLRFLVVCTAWLLHGHVSSCSALLAGVSQPF